MRENGLCAGAVGPSKAGCGVWCGGVSCRPEESSVQTQREDGPGPRTTDRPGDRMSLSLAVLGGSQPGWSSLDAEGLWV